MGADRPAPRKDGVIYHDLTAQMDLANLPNNMDADGGSERPDSASAGISMDTQTVGDSVDVSTSNRPSEFSLSTFLLSGSRS